MTNVRFSRDNYWLLSTGGADHALFQWRFITDEKSALQMNEQQGQGKPVTKSINTLPTRQF